MSAEHAKVSSMLMIPDSTAALTLKASGHSVKASLGAKQVIVNVGETLVRQMIPRARVAVQHGRSFDRLTTTFAALAFEQVVSL